MDFEDEVSNIDGHYNDIAGVDGDEAHRQHDDDANGINNNDDARDQAVADDDEAFPHDDVPDLIPRHEVPGEDINVDAEEQFVPNDEPTSDAGSSVPTWRSNTEFSADNILPTHSRRSAVPSNRLGMIDPGDYGIINNTQQHHGIQNKQARSVVTYLNVITSYVNSLNC